MVALGLVGTGAVDGGSSVPVGCPVCDAEGAKLGTLAGLAGDCLIVAHHLVLEDRVPLRLVAEFDGETIRLRVTKEEIRRGEGEAS